MKKKVEVGGTSAGGESGGVRASLILVTRGPVQSSLFNISDTRNIGTKLDNIL